MTTWSVGGRPYAPAVAESPRSARFACEVAHDALTEQLARIDSLDQKAGIILAAGGIVGGLVLTPDDPLAAFPAWPAMLIIVTLVASLLGSLIALANRRYELAPTPERVASLAGAVEDRLRWMFIGNLLEAVELNIGESSGPRVDG